MTGASPRRPPDAALLRRLAAICGDDHVIGDPQTLEIYAGDAGTHPRTRPAAAVLPGEIDELAEVVRACAAAGVTVVARGAGTGLSGGARPGPADVVVVLTRLRRIIRLDRVDGRVIAEAGVALGAVDRALAPTHRVALDPYSAAVATVGGLVAQNAGGPCSLRHGAAVDQVLGLELVRPDGTRVRLRRDAPGYDVTALVCGAEGANGIVANVELAVTPVPEAVRTLVAEFDATAAAAHAAAAIVAAGLAPTAVELIDAAGVRAAGGAVDTGYRGDAAAALLVEFEGPLDVVLAGLEGAVARCGRAGALDLRIAIDAVDRDRLWSAPRTLFAAMRRVSSGFEILDLAVPPSRLGETVAAVEDLVETEHLTGGAGLSLALLAHAAEGVLHPIIGYDAGAPAGPAAVARLRGRIEALCVAAGGTPAAEHGLGGDAEHRLGAMFAPADQDAFDRLGRALA